MQSYLDLLRKVLKQGQLRPNRTGIDTLSLFGYQLRCDLSVSFPLLTTKAMFWKGIVYELLWFLRGDTNVAYLHSHGVHIWDEWANEDGDLGPIYGAQWRAWRAADGRYIDQITNLLVGLRNDPYSRRHLLSAWNVGELERMALPPCHVLAQFYVAGSRLSCHVYQRSADVFLGLPFNIASYGLLTCLIARVLDYEPDELIFSLGDVHLYVNHKAAAEQQLKRRPRDLPSLRLPKRSRLEDYVFEDLQLIGYDPYPAIPAPVAR